jgi:hypothetical protein
MAIDLVAQAGKTFGFSKWNLGLGSMGTFLVWAFIVLVVTGLIGFLIAWIIYKRTYQNKVWAFGVLGSVPQFLWSDVAKYVKIGNAGDSLFFLKKNKRFVPNPTLQLGPKLWAFWKREDGELINITLANLDKIQREMGIKFVDTDMRMQRLGIEKNLQFRLQAGSFWDQYGDKIINIIFYVLVTILIIVVFYEWRKTVEQFSAITDKQAQIYDKFCPAPTSSGVIPAFFLPLFLIKSKKTKWRKNGRNYIEERS